MTYLKHIALILFGLTALSACSSVDSMIDKSASGAEQENYLYYSQTVPVRAEGFYDTLDTRRYSQMHLRQSAYMFQD